MGEGGGEGMIIDHVHIAIRKGVAISDWTKKVSEAEREPRSGCSI